MGTFIQDGASSLPGIKSNSRTPSGAATEWAAGDANQIRSALLDLRAGALTNTDTVNVKEYATGDGVTDDTAGVQAALDAGAGKEVYFPPGTYIVKPSGLTTWLQVASGTRIRGAGRGVTTIKVANGAGKYATIFAGVGPSLSDPTTARHAAWVDNEFSDFTIDQNVVGNPAQVADVDGEQQACIWSWNPFRVNIERVRFQCCSTFAVNLNSPIHVGSRVHECNFDWMINGTVQYDLSNVYMEGRDLELSNCVFEAANKTNGDARAGFEVHGSSRIVNNVVNGYSIGFHVTAYFNAVETVTSTVVTGNVVKNANNGILIWSVYVPTAPHGFAWHNLVVSDNVIFINNADRQAQYPQGIALNFDPAALNLFDTISITNNVITFQAENRAYIDHLTTYGIGLTPLGSMTNILVSGNIVKNAPNAGLCLIPYVVPVSGANGSTTNIAVSASGLFLDGDPLNPFLVGDEVVLTTAGTRHTVTATPDATHITITPAAGAAPTNGFVAKMGKRIAVQDNVFVDCGNNTSAPDFRRTGIVAAGALEDVKFEGNSFLDSGGATPLGKLAIFSGITNATRVTFLRNTINPYLATNISGTGIVTDLPGAGTALVELFMYVDEAPTWQVDAALGNLFFVSLTLLTQPGGMAVAAPLNPVAGQFITFHFSNDSLVDAILTFNGIFLLAPWVTGVGASLPAAKKMAITFAYSGLSWCEISRTAPH